MPEMTDEALEKRRQKQSCYGRLVVNTGLGLDLLSLQMTNSAHDSCSVSILLPLPIIPLIHHTYIAYGMQVTPESNYF